MIDSKKIILEYGLAPNKALGQNFLVDERSLERIVELVRPENEAVLEIGPGLGALTDLLAECARSVKAIEIDQRMVGLLGSILAGRQNISIINKDFLKLSEQELRAQFTGDFVVAANLPYYITTQCALKLIDSPLPIKRMVLMMQQEAAAHFTAKPRTKCYTAASVLAQHYYRVEAAFDLPPSCYYPAPEVHSTVLLFEPRADAQYAAGFSRLVKAAFSMRRKTLRNNLGTLVPKTAVPSLIEKAGLPPSCRAEELDRLGFCALYEAYAQYGESAAE